MRYHFLVCVLLVGCFLGSIAELQGQLDSLERVLARTEEPSIKMTLLNQIAYQYHPTDSGRAYQYATEALDLSRQLNDAYGSGKAFKNLALTEAYLGYAEKAIALYDSAYHYFSSIPDSSELAAVWNNQGRQLCQVGAFEQAIQGYHQAESWARKAADETKLLIFLFNHAACLTDAFQAEAAIARAQEALELAQELDNWFMKSSLHSLMGINYSDLKQFAEAEAAYDAAFACLPKAEAPQTTKGVTTNNPDLAADILNNRGILFLEQKLFEKAYNDFKTALQLAREYAPEQLNAPFYVNIGIAAKELEKWEESLQYFQEGLGYLEATQQRVAMAETYRHLSGLHFQLKDGMQAYHFLQKYHEIQDSILSEETQKSLEEFDVKYKTAQYKRELSESQLQLQAERHRLNLLGLAVLIVAALLAALYWLYHVRQKNKVLQLEKRQAELQYGLLRAQMNPHFIFNALNAIQGFFVNQKLIQGNEFLGKFSSLIRRVLDQSKLPEHTLAQELDTLKLYLDIEKERLEDHLDYSIHTADNVDSALLELPPLIFQPFVENAIWHGIAPKEGKGHIWIDINWDETREQLKCLIRDNGVGLPSSNEVTRQKHVSKGIQITKERLGNRGTINIQNNPQESGVSVELTISMN
ncbi:MAG: histidine kinase [Saprospiraceae bacterium]|nr:histidine kinase [Saprospiraceae bacterium]